EQKMFYLWTPFTIVTNALHRFDIFFFVLEPFSSSFSVIINFRFNLSIAIIYILYRCFSIVCFRVPS
ncbi:hypothetical protein L9F63_002426, partial [Diploptera punctata]